MIVTQWFDSDIEPVHVGWYQRHYSDFDKVYALQRPDYWNGCNWKLGLGGSLSAAIASSRLPWRGLAVKP